MRNENTEFDQLPSNPARDFFLRNVNFEPFLEGVTTSDKAVMIRELHQMVYLLNIRTLSMKLDQSDWKIVSKVMLSLVIDSMENKLVNHGGAAHQSFTSTVKANVGELNEQEQLLQRLIL